MRMVALVSLLLLVQSLPDIARAQNSSAESSFDGVYLGLELGAAAADGTTDYPVLSGGTVNASFDPDNGRSYGAVVGYNLQRGQLVYGAEIRYSNLSQVVQNDTPDPERRDVQYFADLRGRVGYVRGDLMVYGALGWSWSRFHVHPSANFTGRDSQTSLNGFNVGVGVEYNVSKRWFIGADYTYRDMNGGFDEAPDDLDIDLSTITARVAYRF